MQAPPLELQVHNLDKNATQKSQKVFVHVPSEIASHEVEEIGVEHLLRDVKGTTMSTLATEVSSKHAALKGLDARLREIQGYLDLVIEGKLPLNHEILYHLQDMKTMPSVIFGTMALRIKIGGGFECLYSNLKSNGGSTRFREHLSCV